MRRSTSIICEGKKRRKQQPQQPPQQHPPQQRLLLEVTNEALEHAGIAPQTLRHSKTGVFAGACLGEYGYLAASDLSAVDAWSGTGGAMSIMANRIAHVFDLHGASQTVDTACSSSLVALHLACECPSGRFASHLNLLARLD